MKTFILVLSVLCLNFSATASAQQGGGGGEGAATTVPSKDKISLSGTWTCTPDCNNVDVAGGQIVGAGQFKNKPKVTQSQGQKWSNKSCFGTGASAEEAAKALQNVFRGMDRAKCSTCQPRGTCKGPGNEEKSYEAALNSGVTSPSTDGKSASDGRKEFINQ